MPKAELSTGRTGRGVEAPDDRRLAPAGPSAAALCVLAVVAITVHPPVARGWDEIDKPLLKRARGVEGQLPVILFAQQCNRVGHEECARRLALWKKGIRSHPLVAQAIDYYLAAEWRVLGKREEASALLDRLGFIRAWSYPARGGETVTLTADPVSGLVASADWVELPPGERATFFVEVVAQAPADAVLRVQAAGIEEVCVNGVCQPVGPFAGLLFDQAVIPARFEEGKNRVELVFSAESTNLKFGVRLGTPAGAVLPFAGGAREGEIVLSPRGPSAKAVVPPGQSAVETIRARADATGEDLLLACGALKMQGSPLSEVELHLDAFSPATPEEWVALLHCVQGTSGFWDSLNEALAAAPDSPLLRLELARVQLQVGRTWTAWLSLPGICPDHGFSCLPPRSRLEAALLARDIQRAFGLTFMQEETIRRVMKAGEPGTPVLTQALADVLVEQERYAEAVTVMAAGVEHWPGDYELAAALMYALEKCGRLEEELLLVERLYWLYPTNSYLSQTLGSILYRLGRLDRAAGVYSALEIKGWNNAFLLDQAADFRLATGDQAHALKLWKRVLQLKPQDSSTRELVAKLQAGRPRVDAFLNSEAELRTLAEKVSTEKEARYVGLLDKTRIQLFENRTWTTTRIIAVKALSQCGPDPFEIRFTYDSYIEDAAVLRAATLRPDGSVLPATDYGDHTLSAEEYNLYYELHSMGIRFEGVKPGDILVAAYEVQTAASSLGIPFSGLLWLQDSFAKYNTQVELIVPQEVELFHSIGPAISPPHFEQSLEEEEKTSRHLFRFPRLEAELEEPYPPGRLEIAAHFHFSQIEDWQGFASWYLELITGIGQADAAMRRKVETVVAESGDRQAVIRELCRYAADEIRYVGLELGVHGLKPYSPTEVVRRGFGDCKDKSLLLTTLLGLAGIPASVVILTTAPLGKGDLYPGSPAIFDHAIVHIAEGDFYFDPTARYMGLGLLPWQDQQAQAVVLAPSGPRKVQLPGSEAGQNVVEFSASVAGLEGGLAVSGTLHFTGQFAWRVLQALENRGAWENMVEAEVSSVLPVVELASVEEQVDDEALAVTVRFTGRWQPPDRSRVRILTDVNDTIQLISAASRQLPLVFGYPYRQVYDLQFGKGTFVPGRELTAQVGCDSASFRISSGLAGESTRVLVTFEQTRARIEQELYAEYRSLVNRFLEALAGLEGEVGRE